MNEPAPDCPASPQALGLLQLREDSQYRRIPGSQRNPLVESALEDGRLLAEQTRRRWGRDPSVIASRCGLPVRCCHQDAGFGSTVVYGEYGSRPAAITLYLPAIQALDRLLARQGQSCGDSGTLPMFLAHELYHHFDCERGSARLSRRYAIRIFSVGSWHWMSGLSSLCEIAAGAFAQQLLGLPFHPKYLDSLLQVGVGAKPQSA
jgi:hypothetical protein